MTLDQKGGLRGLIDAFRIQDSVVQANSAAVQAELPLIDRAVILAFELEACLGSAPIKAQHDAKPPDVQAAEAAMFSLLHGAWTGIVSAVRLLLCGAHNDSTALLRSAFEAVYLANYFRLETSAAAGWAQLGYIADDLLFKKEHDKWTGKNNPWGRVEVEAGSGVLRPIFAELSTYGTHANPKSAALRSVNDMPRMANLGFASAGNPEFTRICARNAVWLLKYVVSEYADSFQSYLADAPDLCQAAVQFDRDVATWDRAFPPGLSRRR